MWIFSHPIAGQSCRKQGWRWRKWVFGHSGSVPDIIEGGRPPQRGGSSLWLPSSGGTSPTALIKEVYFLHERGFFFLTKWAQLYNFFYLHNSPKILKTKSALKSNMSVFIIYGLTINKGLTICRDIFPVLIPFFFIFTTVDISIAVHLSRSTKITDNFTGLTTWAEL